jgi:toxin-antitoxin system PIN domain toxin
VSQALLDANVLLALAWPNHQFHTAAHRWFAREAVGGWATCALTQLAFVRLSSNPAFTRFPAAPTEAARLLGLCTGHAGHHFWDSAPALTPADLARALGHQQVNDAYLLALTAHRRGRLITFDPRIPALAGPSAERVLVLAPAP